MNFKNLNFENIKHDAENITIDKNDSYIKAYPEFIKYFETNSPIEKHNLIIGSHFIYGWMPTILTLKLNNTDNVLEQFNKAKNGIILNEAELEMLKTCINNSMVGLSKLLHFINPEKYAIWDSRIYRYITGKKQHYSINNIQNYLDYLGKMVEITHHNKFDQFYESMNKHFENYSITPLRSIEIVMFMKDKQLNNE